MITSLKVAEQFDMGNSILVQRIENLICRYHGYEKHYKQKRYTTERNREYIMYSMDQKGYELLLEWKAGIDRIRKTRIDNIRKLKLELSDVVQDNELTDPKVINKSMELDKHITKEQSERLCQKEGWKIWKT